MEEYPQQNQNREIRLPPHCANQKRHSMIEKKIVSKNVALRERSKSISILQPTRRSIVYNPKDERSHSSIPMHRRNYQIKSIGNKYNGRIYRNSVTEPPLASKSLMNIKLTDKSFTSSRPSMMKSMSTMTESRSLPSNENRVIQLKPKHKVRNVLRQTMSFNNADRKRKNVKKVEHMILVPGKHPPEIEAKILNKMKQIAMSKADQGELNNCICVLQNVLECEKASTNTESIAETLYLIGVTFIKLHKLDAALSNLNESARILLECPNQNRKLSPTSVFHQIGKIHEIYGDDKKAEYYRNIAF